MLLLTHKMATSGNLLKTAVIFGMNPLALNWAQMLALFPAAMAWAKESLEEGSDDQRCVGRGVVEHVQGQPGLLYLTTVLPPQGTAASRATDPLVWVKINQ